MQRYSTRRTRPHNKAVCYHVKGEVLPKATDPAIGQRIKQIREALGPWSGKLLPRSQLGARVGVDESTIKKWETGEATPGAENLRRLAEVSDADVSWILGASSRGSASREIALKGNSPPDCRRLQSPTDCRAGIHHRTG